MKDTTKKIFFNEVPVLPVHVAKVICARVTSWLTANPLFIFPKKYLRYKHIHQRRAYDRPVPRPSHSALRKGHSPNLCFIPLAFDLAFTIISVSDRSVIKTKTVNIQTPDDSFLSIKVAPHSTAPNSSTLTFLTLSR